MKFGGNVLATASHFTRVADLVGLHVSEKPLVIVSTGDPVKELLPGAAWAACFGRDPVAAHWPVANHQYQLLDQLSLPADLVADLLEALRDLLRGIYLLRELTPRTMDLVTSYGELLSARILAELLCRAGVPARDFPAWELGMLTDSEFGAARMLPDAPETMRACWEAVKETVPVVTGRVGRDPQDYVTTMGHGGADLSASLFGEALGAEEVQIWTDVPGVRTCDPRVIPDASTISRLSFQEAAELAYSGARILHPQTIEPAVRAQIPVTIKNVLSPEQPGTSILEQHAGKGGRPVGLAFHRNLSVITINASGMLGASGFLARVFEAFARMGVSVDVVSTSEVTVSFTVDRPPEDFHAAIGALSEESAITVKPGRSAICLVGEGLKQTQGMAARIFGVLDGAGARVEMVSQGASQINITLVVRDEDCETAVRALHAEFFAKGAQGV